MKTNSIIVVGSLNMDFIVQVERLPLPGQTVIGRGFEMLPGGKGANQACAAGRLRGKVRMIGRVGEDVFGQRLKESLSSAGVDTTQVLQTPGEPTGVALIAVEQGGQNQIVVAAGANGRLSPSDLEAGLNRMEGGFVLLQLESPLQTLEAAMARAREHGATTILDPAPARTLPSATLSQVSVLTPNESEALQLLGLLGSSIALSEAPGIARALRERGPETVILKLGERGAWLADGKISQHFPARSVLAVDVTAAGDTFNGALAVALAEGRPWKDAIPFANCAAGIAVTRPGAQASIPSREEVDRTLPRRSSVP